MSCLTRLTVAHYLNQVHLPRDTVTSIFTPTARFRRL